MKDTIPLGSLLPALASASRAACATLSLAFVGAVSAATINVNSNSTLTSALASANPGDEIVLADGSYAGFTVTRSGSSSAPIVIRAANQGSATINSGVVYLNHVSYVTLQGFTVTTSGGSRSIDGETYNVAVWLEATSHCRLTRSTLRLSGAATATHYVLLGGHGDSNRIDHNEFGPNSVDGVHYIWPRGQRSIPGVTPPSDRTSWANGNGPVNPNIPLHTQIDHNYLHDQHSGTAEAMVIGGLGVTGDYQDYFTTIEYNLIVNCDGDPEFISVKSSGNIIRYNTVRTSAGMISLRSGNHNQVYGNILLQGGKSGTGGIKFFEKDHVIYNNYIDHADQYPILIGTGDSYTSGSFTHAQVFRAKVLNNTVVNVNNTPVSFGFGAHSLGAVDTVFANNIVSGSAKPFFQILVQPTNVTYSSNIAWPVSGGTLGSTTPFTVEDPKFAASGELQKLTSSSPAIDAGNATLASFITDDMDGQPRSAIDIGADEFSSAPVTRVPLTTADVGPNSPPDSQQQVADPVISPASGTFSSPPTVTMMTGTAGASIRYTVDGTDPSPNLGTIYTGSFVPSTGASTLTIKAIAYENGFLPSHIVTVVYTIVSSQPPASAPVLNPGTGTYAAGQQVSMSSNTPGAVIHYTTDNTDPTSSSGNVYSSPITITSTTTVKAIASASGFSDSSITSATYTIPGGTTTLNWEAESLARTVSGATATNDTDASASGGVRVTLASNSVGDYVEFTLPNVAAGTYSVRMAYKTNNNRGILKLTVDGTQVGNTLDQYAASASYPTATFGNVTFASAGNHTVRLTVTGKNGSSSSYTLSADKFTFVGQ